MWLSKREARGMKDDIDDLKRQIRCLKGQHYWEAVLPWVSDPAIKCKHCRISPVDHQRTLSNVEEGKCRRDRK